MIKLLLRTPLASKQEQYAKIAASSADSLLFVINEVLDFSKIEAGKMELTTIPFNLRGVIEDVVQALLGQAAEKGLELVQLVHPDVPECVCGDGNKLRQILTNLINNAIKFTEKGEVLIRVTTREEAENYATCHFEVNDTGVGIPQDSLHKLFKSFSQVDASPRRRFGGTGLGLAICKCLVELMGGEIGMNSKVGQGTSFWFTLKFERASTPEEEIPSPPISSNRGDPRVPIVAERATPREIHERANILLVEDHDVNRQVAIEVLTHAGHECDVASTGKEAVEAVMRKAYDVVLMDCQMPEMGGFEATRRIRELEGRRRLPRKGETRLPIIAMTANAIKGDRERCLEVGMDDYLSKPLDVGLLLETIEHYLTTSDRDPPEDQAEGRVGDGVTAELSTESPNRGLEKASEATATPFEHEDETLLHSAEATPPFDAEELFDRCMGNAQTVNKLLGMFERKVVDTVERLSDSISGGDAARTADVAHALKGAAANMSAQALKKLAARVEMMGRSRDLDDAAACLGQIRTELDRCLAAIPEVRATVDGLRQAPQGEDTRVIT